ncbi:glycoside hydrolase [Vararia minispora EC-137]|uniref:Glycoside hydrolase n=1 Tax=Vararia minispora EC-137 TaxID=1314806 RepID=A0ACB8QRR3_9AGAM|nr:glycoside hydrolase [Vararia minispora EC-137]
MAAQLHRAAFIAGIGISLVSAFNNNARTNVSPPRCRYWGQNSYGATHTSDTANWQQTISHYCQDSNIDAIPIAFLDVAFGAGGLPSIDLANICNINDDPVFPGSELPDCSFLAAGIEQCQAGWRTAGKIVTLSIGGATGAVGFTSDSQAESFATQVWNLFLGGSSSTRPFGAAVLDGVDLDLEGGSQTGWPAFVTQIRTLAAGASKQYYVTGAPQCPFPDAFIGNTLNTVAFDAIYVQFYNNFCGLTNFNNPNDWNFGTWDNWAKTVSPNPSIKIYIGAPASSTAAGSGYVDATTLATIIKSTAAQYSSFGGVMLWDASQAYANNRYDAAVKSALLANVGSAPASVTTTARSTTTTATKPLPTTTTTSAKPTTTSTPSGSCGVVAAWVANVAYTSSRARGPNGGYSGFLWTANQWNFAETPGGPSGAWDNEGPCVSTQATRTVASLTNGPRVSMTPHPSSGRALRFNRE